MRKIEILSIRKNTNKEIASIEKDYISRLKSRITVQLTDIRTSYSDSQPVPMILEKEAALFEKHFKPSPLIISLDERGKLLSSPELADKLQAWLSQTRGTLVFVVGGAYGLHDSVLKKSSFVLSLSRLTLTHEIARLVLIEALYRSMLISSDHPYHK